MTMKVAAILLVLASVLASAQTKTPSKKLTGKISPQFSKAAIKSLTATMRENDDSTVRAALVEAESAAASPAENALVDSLQCFYVARGFHVENGSALSDEACFAAWKASLRALNSRQPKECAQGACPAPR
jgi:hypothetical protein